jgi:hypothetical protein
MRAGLSFSSFSAVRPFDAKFANWLDASDPARTHNQLLEEHFQLVRDWIFKLFTGLGALS